MAFWVGGPHQTSGLSGYPARDFGAPGGTPFFSWGQFKVRRISGEPGYRGGGFGGMNVYLQDELGGEYFVTHLEGLRVKVGDVLRPGQQIGVVGSYGTPHAHVGYTRGDPVSVLGLKPEYLFSPGGAVAGSHVIQDSSSRSNIGLRLPQIPSLPLPGLPDRPKDPNDLIPSIPGAPSLGDFGDFFSAAARWLTWPFTNWDRLLEVLGGFVLLLIGLILMGRSLGLTRTKMEVVTSKLPGEVTGRAPVESREEPVRVPKSKVVYDVSDSPSSRRRSSRASSSQTDEIPF